MKMIRLYRPILFLISARSMIKAAVIRPLSFQNHSHDNKGKYGQQGIDRRRRRAELIFRRLLHVYSQHIDRRHDESDHDR